MKRLFAIIAGDPISINTEIIAKIWKNSSSNQKKYIIIGSYKIFENQLKKNKIKVKLNNLDRNLKNLDFKKLNILNIPTKLNLKKVDKNLIKNYIRNSVNLANKLSKNKIISGFINCPIDKRNLDFKLTGLTEYLASINKINGKEAMFLYGDKFSVSPITTHIPLNKVNQSITKDKIIDKIKTINLYYKKFFKIKPTIVVLGLNPHNNEFSKFSKETKVILPAVNHLKKIGINLDGPFPADTILLNKKKFNIIVGMYHDQVLPIFKAIHGFNAVNITLGLNYLRMSPDHGTAAKLIYKNKGNTSSLKKCINLFNSINAKI